MSKNKNLYSKEDLTKAIDETLEDLDLEETKDVEIENLENEKEDVVVEEKEEVVEKAKKKKESDKNDDDDDDEDGEDGKKKVPEQFEKKKDKKEKKDKKVKKSIEVDESEYNDLKKAFVELEELKKTEEDSTDLKKALTEISDLKKSVAELKAVPDVKKSVDGIDIIEKGNAEDGKVKTDKDPKSLLSKLSKTKVADIMFEELKKGETDITSEDISGMAATGYIDENRPEVLNQTLEAIGQRVKDGRL